MNNAAKTHCPQGHEYKGKNLRIKGRRRICRTCTRTQALARIARNRGHVLRLRRAWKAANRDRLNALRKAKYARDKEHINELKRNWYQKNIGTERARNRA